MTLIDRRTYRGKNPTQCCGFVNDRTIIYISSSGDQIQYDGPAVAPGRLRPLVTREQFEKWASHDVTEQLPTGCYMPWRMYLERKKS